MILSARNELLGTVEDVQIGDMMVHVFVRIGEDLIESVITRSRADELGLKNGDSICVVVKPTDVKISRP